jgi:hypothetical protein
MDVGSGVDLMADGPFGYWTYNNTNGLKGAASTVETLPDGRRVIVKNPENPAVLEDFLIIQVLEMSPKARHDFNIIFPTLLPEEQERLSNLITENPRISLLETDDQTYYDNIQKYNVYSGVRVRLPRPTARLPGRIPR